VKRRLTKYQAYQKALSIGVDFDKDFFAQSFGMELSEIAREAGYRRPPSAAGSTGRYFFYHLLKLRNRFGW